MSFDDQYLTVPGSRGPAEASVRMNAPLRKVLLSLVPCGDLALSRKASNGIVCALLSNQLRTVPSC